MSSAQLVHDAAGILREFNQAGLLLPADVHTARNLANLGGSDDETVALAAALAVRAPRVGHVSIDITTAPAVTGAEAGEDLDIGALPWPDPDQWLARLQSSPLVAVGENGEDRPLRLIGTSLYLDRYWRDEIAVAANLLGRTARAQPEAGELTGIVDRLFTGTDDGDQRAAVEVAVSHWFSVIAGGPGTGKTTTVARLLATLYELARAGGNRPPLVALAAPTGKAAARLQEAVQAAAAGIDLVPQVRDALTALTGSTLHRLLGARRGSSRFRYHRGLRLPHDVIVVDEASMVSLALMARLTEAVRPDARLVLVGDPEQLVSVEAGAVLADVVGPGPATPGSALAGSIAVLRTNHRFGGALAELAAAVRAGDDDAGLAVLRAGDPTVSWQPDAARVRDGITAWTTRLHEAARSPEPDGRSALAALASHRVLCAHRQGPEGALAWNHQIESWVHERWPETATEGSWYAGRPVLVTANDYSLRLYNGDSGLTATESTGVAVIFDDNQRPRWINPSRLADVETVYAMTVHKAQGSEFDEVTLILPAADSRLLTRELLYTAVTRARRRLTVVGSEPAIRAGIRRPIARASGLTGRLWS